MDLRAAMIAVIVLVLVGIGYLTYRMQSIDHAPAQSSGVTQSLPSPPAVSASRQAAPAPAAPARQKPESPVDSIAADGWYDLSEWSLRPRPAGWVDNARIVEGPADPGAVNSIVELSGWAGLADLGMRMQHVLLAACGKVFATVPVNGVRPDVAANAHPNLGRSGWVARIALGHVPDCADRTVSAFAVAALSGHAWPLQQGAKVASTLLPAAPDGPRPRAAASLLRPGDVGEVRMVDIAVNAASLNMRSCADAKCKTVEKIGKGSYSGIVVDEANGWLLVQLEDKAGWMAKQHVAVRSR